MTDYDVKESKVTGHVKWFNTKSGYGFIKKDSDGGDVFVHHSSISASNSNSLADGEEVLFDVIDGPKGLEARNVSGPDGGDVVGGKPFQQTDNRSNMRRGGPRNDFRNQPYSRNGGGGGGQPRRDYNDRQGGDIQFGRYENNDGDRRRPQQQSQGYSNRGYGNSKGGGQSYGQRDMGSSRGGQRQGGRGNYSGGYDSRNKGHGGGDNYE